MAKGSIRWVSATRRSDHPRHYAPPRHAVLVASPEWARGLASLIKLSDEYRDVGLLVTNVGPGTAAATAGIERGDVLLRYDGVPLEQTELLISLAGVATPGETRRQVSVDVVRGTGEMTLTVDAGRLGITVSPLLHRLGASRRTMKRDSANREPEEDGERAGADDVTTVEVPGELAPKVSLLADALQRPHNAKQRKQAEALLLTAAGMG